MNTKLLSTVSAVVLAASLTSSVWADGMIDGPYMSPVKPENNTLQLRQLERVPQTQPNSYEAAPLNANANAEGAMLNTGVGQNLYPYYPPVINNIGPTFNRFGFPFGFGINRIFVPLESEMLLSPQTMDTEHGPELPDYGSRELKAPPFFKLK